MPCYFFTYHGYGTWLPDKRRGYVKRGAGILPRDGRMAELYRTNMTQAAVRFEERVQKLAIEELLVACQHQQLRCHFIATDATHVHVLVSWKIDRTWDVVRAKLRESLTRWLNQEIDRQEWFAKSPSRKRVRDRKHFDYLVAVYLPKHADWKWAEGQGLFL